MPLLPTELDSLQDDLEVWFEDLCEIQRDTRVDDTYGGRDETYAAVATSIPCMVVPGMSVGHRSLEELVGELRLQLLFTVSFPVDTDVRVNDRLKITSRNNLLLRVQVVMNPETMDIELQVIANLLV